MLIRARRWALSKLSLSAFGIGLSLFDQAVISAANFTTGILIARFLGIEEFGRYVLAFMVIVGANIFQQALIINPMLSIGSKKAGDADARSYFTALLLHQAALSAGVAAIILTGSWLAKVVVPAWDVGELAAPLVVATISFQWQEFMRRYFFTCGRIRTAVINDSVRYGAQLAALAATIYFNEGTTAATILVVIALAAMLAVAHASLCYGPLEWRGDVFRSSVAEHWRFSRWLVPTAVLQTVNSTDWLSAAGYFQGAASVGALRAAQNIVGMLNVIFLGVENFVQVKTARIFGLHGSRALLSVIVKFTVVGALTTGFVVTLIWLNARWLLSLFYGDQYLGAEYLVGLWGVYYAIYFFHLPGFIAVRAMERTKHLLMAEVLQIVFTVPAIYPLSTYLGATGTMIGVICCAVLVPLYYGIVLWKILSTTERSRRITDL